MSKPKQSHFGLRSFVSYSAQYKWRFLPIGLLFVLSNISLAIVPIFIGKLIGALSAEPVQGHEAVILVWVLIGLNLVHNWTWRICEFLYAKFLLPISFNYETLLFRRIVHQSYPYFVDKFTGKVSSYITTISQEVRDLMAGLFFDDLAQLVNVISMILILTAINWQTGVIFSVGLLGMLIVGRYTLGKSNFYERKAADVVSTKNGKLIDAIANFVNVKSFHKEGVETERIGGEQTKAITANKRAFLWAILFWGSMSFFVRTLIWPICIGLNVYLFFQHKISLAELTTLLSAILLFTTTIWDLVWEVSQLNLKLARTDEAHSYLFGEVNIIRQSAGQLLTPSATPAFDRHLTLAKLDFAYPDKPDVPVLKAIDLELRKGEKIGIVGRSGSGKTTLTKLLLGYYPAPANEILLDGRPINTRELAQLISYVPQDTSLFHRSIGENIAYAAEGTVTNKAIVKAARQAHAEEFVSQLAHGYDTLVGERGVKLSAGQRQRIAIARAFLDDKPILILDEATSALDSESEILVQQALEALWHDKTVIAIAHRLSTLRHMDRIVVIDKGCIVEQGSHADLLKQKGAYAKLWLHQSDGFIEA